MIKNDDLVATREDVLALVEKLKNEECLSVDTEFIREKTFFPQLEIIQVGTAHESWLVDARAFLNKKEDLKPLLDLFQNPKVLKILHAGQADQEAIYLTFGVTLSPSFDTSVAAALCGYGDGVGLANLLQSVLGVKIKKGFARSNWALRPLPKKMLDYAHVDVEHLVQLHDSMKDSLQKWNRYEWAIELSGKLEDPAQYEPNPKDVTDRIFKGGRIDKKSYGILYELVKWREDRVRRVNVPKKWLADDTVLIDLTVAKPKNADELLNFRGLNRGEAKNQGHVLIGLIEKGLLEGDKNAPSIHKEKRPSLAESRAIELLRCFLGMLAIDHQIALRYLVPTHCLVTIIRESPTSIEDLIEKDIISKGAAKLVGEPLVEFIRGETALALKNGKVELTPLKGGDS